MDIDKMQQLDVEYDSARWSAALNSRKQRLNLSTKSKQEHNTLAGSDGFTKKYYSSVDVEEDGILDDDKIGLIILPQNSQR